MNLYNVKDYESAVAYCLEIPRFTRKNSTEDTRAFYEFLGCPGSHSQIVHVAGTNGKGSVCAFLQSICIQMNKRVGMFTSPHLCDVRERVRINGEWIAKEDFSDAFVLLVSKLNQFTGLYSEKKEYHPSFFEWLFFLAMLHFEKTKPEIILLETGLGGRLDATNCVKSPALTVITKIGYDHMEYLGKTIVEIAGEKAGIIKEGVPLVFWQDKKEADAVIIRKAQNLSSPCIMVSKEDVALHFFRDKRIDFSYKSRYYGYIGFSVETSAMYQMENAALAVAAAEELFGKTLEVEVLRKGINQMHWEGRMEEVMPGVFFDGAHNEDGIDAFLKSVHQDGCRGTRSLLFSVVSDKQYRKMAKMITDSGLWGKIYTAPIDSARGVDGKELVEIFGREQNVMACSSPEMALREMLDNRGADDYLYVAGSLYLIGQLKSWLKGVV